MGDAESLQNATNMLRMLGASLAAKNSPLAMGDDPIMPVSPYRTATGGLGPMPQPPYIPQNQDYRAMAQQLGVIPKGTLPFAKIENKTTESQGTNNTQNQAVGTSQMQQALADKQLDPDNENLIKEKIQKQQEAADKYSSIGNSPLNSKVLGAFVDQLNNGETHFGEAISSPEERAKTAAQLQNEITQRSLGLDKSSINYLKTLLTGGGKQTQTTGQTGTQEVEGGFKGMRPDYAQVNFGNKFMDNINKVTAPATLTVSAINNAMAKLQSGDPVTQQAAILDLVKTADAGKQGLAKEMTVFQGDPSAEGRWNRMIQKLETGNMAPADVQGYLNDLAITRDTLMRSVNGEIEKRRKGALTNGGVSPDLANSYSQDAISTLKNNVPPAPKPSLTPAGGMSKEEFIKDYIAKKKAANGQ